MSRRRADYVSEGTQSFSMVVTPAQAAAQTYIGGCVTNANATRTCTVNNVNVGGNQTIGVTASLFDQTGAAGQRLCYGATTAYIQQGAANTINVDCDPIVTAIAYTLNDPATGTTGNSSISIAAATSSNFTGSLIVLDPDGYQVSYGPVDHYRDPTLNVLSLTNVVVGNSAVSVSPSSYTSFSSGFTLSGAYAGGNSSTATITPTVNGNAVPDCGVASPSDPICSQSAMVQFH